VYEESLTGQPHDTSVQKAASDSENVDAVTLTVKRMIKKSTVVVKPDLKAN